METSRHPEKTFISLEDLVKGSIKPTTDRTLGLANTTDALALESAFSAIFEGRHQGNQIAFCTGEETINYRELQDLATRAARIFLLLQGTTAVKPGNSLVSTTHRVIISVTISPALCGLLLGCIASGCLLVYLEPHSPDTRWREVLDDFEPDFLVVDDETLQRLTAIRLTGDKRFATLNLGKCSDLVEALKAIPECTRIPAFDAERPALVIYTSGSTGKSKGVVLTHGNISKHAPSDDLIFPIYPTDQILCLGSWNNAPLVFVFAVFRTGACMHHLTETVSRFPQAVAEYLQKHRITWFSAPASYHARLLKYGSLESRELNLRAIEFWGESVYTTQVKQALSAIPGIKVVSSYSCSEALCSSIKQITADNIDTEGEVISVRPVEGVKACSTHIPV